MTTIDQILAEKLSNWYVGEWPVGNFVLCTIAMLLSIILCGAIGIERERRGRTAGLRTHLLVGVGSCMIMIISIYGFPVITQRDQTFTRDVARLAAQVITGVGFLGAGAIIHRNSATKGLTTAATIWIAMAIGLACGSMNFILATGGTLLILIVLTVFRRFELQINKASPLIILRAKIDVPIAGRLLEVAKSFNCTVTDLRIELNDNDDIEVTFLAIGRSNDWDSTEFIAQLEKIEGVIHVGVVNSHKG